MTVPFVIVKKQFRKTYAGLQWPGANPGAVVVLGEDHEVNRHTNEHSIHLLAEYENRTPTELFVRCVELRKAKEVENFFGDTLNKSMMKLLRQGKFQVSLSKAPFVDDPDMVETYLSIIREKTSADRKVLHFKGGSRLPAILSSLADIPKDLKRDNPLVAALGYALAALVFKPYGDEMRLSGVSYRPLDPVVGY